MEIVFAKDKKQKKNPLKQFGKNLKEKVKSFRPSNTFYYFLILLVIGVGFYMLMLIDNGFTLAYGGDYSAQYIPMGYHVWDYYHEWIKTGHFTLYDPAVYLGANSFGSNAYYGLFSPFNIIIVLFPRAIVPQMMAITSIIKLACAGLFFSIYMRAAFKVKDQVSYICGICYGFAGWGAFYLWYNNYQDILVFFPIVLLGVEKVIKEEKPWILALGVFFLAICNYVLMVSYIVCGFLYAMFRYFQTMNTRGVVKNFKVLGLGFAGFAGGLMMSLFIFGPALLATMASPKLDTNSYGGLLKEYLSKKDFKSFFETLFSWNRAEDQHRRLIPDRAFFPILEFFFPPTTCRSLPTLEIKGWDFDDFAVSLWCYIPMIMFLVPALIQSGKEKKWSHYIGFALMLLILFTPFMYYATMAFTNGYARWTLFIPACLVAYVGIYLDKIPNVSRWHIHVGYTFAIAGIVTAWILTYKLTGHKVMQYYSDKYNATDEFIHRFAEEDSDFTNIAFIVELIYVTGVYFTLFFLYNKKKAFMILTTAFVAVEAIAAGNFVTLGHGYDDRHNNGYANNERFKNLLNKIQKTDKSFYRVYASIGDGVSGNNGLMNNYSSTSFFHSLYNFEVNDFTLWTGMRDGEKSVAGSYRGKWADLDNLLGIKYYIVSKEKSKYDLINYYYPNGYAANVPLDCVERKEFETKEYKVYENTKLNGFGYAYDTVYNGELNKSRWGITPVNNSIAMMEKAVINAKDAEEIANNGINVTTEKPNTYELKTLSASSDYTYKIYKINREGVKEDEDWKNWAKNYEFDKIATIPETPEICKSIGAYVSEDSLKYFGFYTSQVANQPLFKAGTTVYIKADYGDNERFDFYFITKDDNGEYKIFMMDAHDDDNTDVTTAMRAFYCTKDVYRVAVMGKWYKSHINPGEMMLYKEEKSSYETRMNALDAGSIINVKYRADKFTFDTKFTSNKFVVSQVAYDVGWKIKATNNATKQVTNLKVYKGNGGFVSFIAQKGDYSYTMSYETPYLKISYIVSAAAFITYFTSMLGYHFYQEKKRNHYLDNLFREN